LLELGELEDDESHPAGCDVKSSETIDILEISVYRQTQFSTANFVERYWLGVFICLFVFTTDTSVSTMASPPTLHKGKSIDEKYTDAFIAMLLQYFVSYRTAAKST
jgi:hypothetical protein